MNLKETATIVGMLQLNYAESFRGKSDEALTAVVKLWHRMFAEDDYLLVCAAVESYIATDTGSFMPTIGQIKEAIRNITSPATGLMTELEAWSKVSRAISNGIYGAKEEFAKLPPQIQSIVGRPEQLTEWAMMDADTVQSVIASNFQRSFRVRQSRDLEQQKIPGSVRQYMAELAEQTVKNLPSGE